MAKSKQKKLFEKKTKLTTEFDKNSPEKRVKTIKTGKVVKKGKKEVAKTTILKAAKDPETKKLYEKKEKKTIDGNTPAVDLKEKISEDVIKSGLVNLRKGIKKEIETNTKIAKNLFDDELRYGLNVIGFKIPNGPSHTRKILLQNSLYDENPDICFFIADSIPKKADQDETVSKFKETLKNADINNISHVMTLGQLKRDYSVHNMKLKLCNTYDVFFVESKIAEHVYSVLGKPFIKKRKRPFQVDLKSDKIKITIQNALKKSVMKITPKSIISSFEIGVAKMDDEKITANITAAIEQLKEKWPGGWKNVSRIYLRPMQPSKVSIPLYISEVNPNDVPIPVIVGAKQKRLTKLEKKLKIKSEKLKIDLESKKVIVQSKKFNKRKNEDDTDGVKSSPKKLKTEENVNIKKKNKNKKKTEAVEIVAEKVENKKKKKKEVQIEQEVVQEVKEKKKKQHNIEEQVENVKKNEKKKKKIDVAEKESAAIKPSKKNKKKSADELVIAATPEAKAEEQTKPKNKKKSTAAVTDAINSHDEKSKAEKDQTDAKNKKKKSKKNKA